MDVTVGLKLVLFQLEVKIGFYGLEVDLCIECVLSTRHCVQFVTGTMLRLDVRFTG